MRTNAIRVMLVLALVSALAVMVASAQKSGGPLSGTSWQLVKFQGPDGQTFAPEDNVKVHDHVWP